MRHEIAAAELVFPLKALHECPSRSRNFLMTPINAMNSVAAWFHNKLPLSWQPPPDPMYWLRPELPLNEDGETNLWKRFINESAVSHEANEFSEANFPLESASSLIYCKFSSNLGEFLIFAARRAETFLCPLLINSFDCNCTKWRCCRDEFIMTEFIWWEKWGSRWISKKNDQFGRVVPLGLKFVGWF